MGYQGKSIEPEWKWNRPLFYQITLCRSCDPREVQHSPECSESLNFKAWDCTT